MTRAGQGGQRDAGHPGGARQCEHVSESSRPRREAYGDAPRPRPTGMAAFRAQVAFRDVPAKLVGKDVSTDLANWLPASSFTPAIVAT